MYVFMYVYMYVYMYVCIYVCIYMYVCMYVCMSDLLIGSGGRWRIELSDEGLVEVAHVDHDAVVTHHRSVELLRGQVRTYIHTYIHIYIIYTYCTY